MVPTAATEASAAQALRMRVEGMDCSACAIKIENALKRLPGLSGINMNYATEMLSLQLDEGRTPLAAVESRIRSLGYTPIALGGAASHAVGTPTKNELEASHRPWWRTRKGYMVLGLAALLTAAFAIASLRPQFAFFG